jgi:hypothetical protein
MLPETLRSMLRHYKDGHGLPCPYNGGGLTAAMDCRLGRARLLAVQPP